MSAATVKKSIETILREEPRLVERHGVDAARDMMAGYCIGLVVALAKLDGERNVAEYFYALGDQAIGNAMPLSDQLAELFERLRATQRKKD